MAPNLGEGHHGYLTLTMTGEKYTEQTGYAFVPPNNLDNYPPRTGTTQEQALGTEKFRQNQELLKKYTAMDRAIKDKIVTAVEPVFLFPLVYQLTVFRQVSALTMRQNIFKSYGKIEEAKPEGNVVKKWGLITLQNP